MTSIAMVFAVISFLIWKIFKKLFSKNPQKFCGFLIFFRKNEKRMRRDMLSVVFLGLVMDKIWYFMKDQKKVQKFLKNFAKKY